jgi:cytosine deaminase
LTIRPKRFGLFEWKLAKTARWFNPQIARWVVGVQALNSNPVKLCLRQLVIQPGTCFNPRMDAFLQAAIEEARTGLAAGGIPIGSVLVLDGKIIGRGHNQRVQHGSVIHHAEMNCLENAGRLKASVYKRCVLYSTLSPCPMCSGAILLYKIPRLVVGENKTFQGPEEYVRSQGVQMEVLQDPACIQLMRDFIKARPELWNEDIGE